MPKNQDPASLISLQRDYIIKQLKAIQVPGSLYVLIVDDDTEAILNKVIQKDKLLRIVTTIEKVDAKKKQQAFMEAIYFVDTSMYNLKCILGDIQTNKFKKGHGLFLPLLSDDNRMEQFFKGPNFLRNPKVSAFFDRGQSIGFMTSSMSPVETRVFLTDDKTPNSMPIYFNENCAELVLPQIKQVAKSLVDLVVLTGEYPLIRYYSPLDSKHQASRLCELIADEFQRQIDNYARLNHDYPPPPSLYHDKPRSIMVICDRTVDLFSPLLHEFSYQAMAMDIVPSLERKGKYVYQAENEKGESTQVESTLDNEEDDDWVKLRHLHIIESSELIINEINELIKNNPLMVDRSKATTSSDLMYIVAHLKGFDEERKQITLHKTLIDECLDINASRKLAEFAADFEQTCTANGVTFEGIKVKNLHDDLIVLLAREDLHINDKMRLVLIYALYRGGLIEQDFVKLAKFIGVNDRQIISLISRCFTNLHKLGFPIVKKTVKDKNIERHSFHTINNEGTYNTSRFIPGLKNILQNAAKYQLDEDWFPYFRDKPLEDDIPASSTHSSNNGMPNSSLRNTRIKASWAQSSHKSQGSARPRQKIFCYVAGGVTYSELRSIYELSNTLNKDFYIGSETILKPRDFLIGLQTVDKVKSLPDLDLNLFDRLREHKEPPLYLFETKPPAQHPSPSQAAPNQPAKNGQNGNHISAADVPAHYQKRQSSYNANQDSISKSDKTKEKKTKKLKNLFK